MAIELRTPKSSDGKFIFLPAQFRGDVQVYFPGAADDIDSGVRHGGELFAAQSTVVEEKTIEFQFAEFVYFVGGIVRWSGAALGDSVTYEAVAPATPATEEPGGGEFTKVPIGGGINMFVPYPGGGWDIDLAEKASENVRFTKATPVPGPEGLCPFNWDEATDEVSVVGNGSYYLFDSEIVLACFLPRFPLLGDGAQEFLPASVKAKKMLPHWRHRVRLDNTTAKILSLVWVLYAARLDAGCGQVVT